MKIKKEELLEKFYHYYYQNNNSYIKNYHGLDFMYILWGIGYRYHEEKKGFWLKNNKY